MGIDLSEGFTSTTDSLCTAISFSSCGCVSTIDRNDALQKKIPEKIWAAKVQPQNVVHDTLSWEYKNNIYRDIRIQQLA